MIKKNFKLPVSISLKGTCLEDTSAKVRCTLFSSSDFEASFNSGLYKHVVIMEYYKYLENPLKESLKPVYQRANLHDFKDLDSLVERMAERVLLQLTKDVLSGYKIYLLTNDTYLEIPRDQIK